MVECLARFNQQGLTLLELTVTLLILVMLTSVAIRSTSGLQEQARFQQTKDRLEMIREAILGDPRKTMNGQPVISGFVADMGRLPACLRELLTPLDCGESPAGLLLWPQNLGVCSDAAKSNKAACTGGNAQWIELVAGWRGPYVQTRQPWNDASAFTDGWGSAGDTLNYGWLVDQKNPDTGAADLRFFLLQSPAGTNRGAEYQSAYPSASLPVASPQFPEPLAKPANWLVDLAATGLAVDTGTPATSGAPTKALCARVYVRDGAALKMWYSDKATGVTVAEDGQVHPLDFVFKAQGSPAAAPVVPLGEAAFGLYETDDCSTGDPALYRAALHPRLARVVFLPGVTQRFSW